MPSPPLSIRTVKTELVQPSASKWLEIVHNALRLLLTLDNQMNVISPDMSRQQVPLALRAAFHYRVKNHSPSWFVHGILRLLHP